MWQTSSTPRYLCFILFAVAVALLFAEAGIITNRQVISAPTVSNYFGSSFDCRPSGSVFNTFNPSNSTATFVGNAFWDFGPPNGYLPAQGAPAGTGIAINASAQPYPPNTISCLSTSAGEYIVGSYWHQPGGMLYVVVFNVTSSQNEVFNTLGIIDASLYQWAYRADCSDELETVVVQGRQLASAPGNNNHIFIMKRATPSTLYTWNPVINDTFDILVGGQPMDQDVAVSADGNVAAYGRTQGVIRTWNIPALTFSDITFNTTEVPYSIALNADGSFLAYGDLNYISPTTGFRGRIIVYRNVSGTWTNRAELVYPFAAASISQGYDVAFSCADGHTLIVGMPGGLAGNGAISGWQLVTRGGVERWTPLPYPMLVFNIGGTLNALGSVVVPLADGSRVLAGGPARPSLNRGNIYFYANVSSCPPPTPPTAPNMQSNLQPTSVGVTNTSTYRALAVASNGAFYVTAAVNNINNVAYNLVYNLYTPASTFVMDSTFMQGVVANVTTTDKYYQSCTSTNKLVYMLATWWAGGARGSVAIWVRANTSVNFALNPSNIQDPVVSAPGRIWAKELVCADDVSFFAVSILNVNTTPSTVAFSVYRRATTTSWTLNITTTVSTTSSNSIVLGLSRDNQKLIAVVDGTRVYDYTIALPVVTLNQQFNVSVPGLFITTVALDYYRWRLALGDCFYNSSAGIAIVYQYSLALGRFDIANPQSLYYPLDTSTPTPQQGNGLSFDGSGEYLCVVAASTTNASIVVWRAALFTGTWSVHQTLSTFGETAVVPLGNAGFTMARNFMSLDATSVSYPGATVILSYDQVANATIIPATPVIPLLVNELFFSSLPFPHSSPGVAIAATSTGEGIAAMGFNTLSTITFAVVWNYNPVTNASTVRGRVDGSAYGAISTTFTTVRISDDKMRVIIATAPLNPTSTPQAHTKAYVYNITASQYDLQSDFTSALNVSMGRGMDLTRDGVWLAIGAPASPTNNSRVYMYMLRYYNSSDTSDTYHLQQAIPPPTSVSQQWGNEVRITAYGIDPLQSWLVVSSLNGGFVDIYQLDALNITQWVYRQRLLLFSTFFIDGLAIAGDGSVIQINFRGSFNATGYFAVAIAKYINSTVGFGEFAYIMPPAGNTNSTLGPALSTNDYGTALIVPRDGASPILYDIYQNQQPLADVGSWTYSATVPAPPGSTSLTSQGQSTGDAKSLTADCSLIITGTLTRLAPSEESTGFIAIYRTSLPACPVLPPPALPPIAPPFDPPFDPPVAPVAPFDPPVAPVAPFDPPVAPVAPFDPPIAPVAPFDPPVAPVAPFDPPVAPVAPFDPPVVPVAPFDPPVAPVAPFDPPVAPVAPFDPPVVPVAPFDPPVVPIAPFDPPVVPVAPFDPPVAPIAPFDPPIAPFDPPVVPIAPFDPPVVPVAPFDPPVVPIAPFDPPAVPVAPPVTPPIAPPVAPPVAPPDDNPVAPPANPAGVIIGVTVSSVVVVFIVIVIVSQCYFNTSKVSKPAPRPSTALLNYKRL